MSCAQLLKDRSTIILAQAQRMMARAHLQSYEKAGATQTFERLQMLYALVQRSVEDKSLTRIRRYAEDLARERYEAGFDLWEVQTAFNVLEEAIWLHILKELQPEEFAEAISIISSVLGVGKDTLARTYVFLASRHKASSLDVQMLFSGTE